MQVQPGDLFLLTTPGMPGRVIRLVTRSRVNHAGIVVDEAGTTVEAMPRGAMHGQVGPRHIIVRPPMSDVQRAMVVTAARRFVGTPYGFADIAALGLAWFGLRPAFIRRRIARSSRVICSQLVVLCLLAAGIRLYVDDRLPQDVTPGDLLELAVAAGWVLGADEVYPRSGGHPDDHKP
ncbi:hypothetical protein [Pseudonocardia parietis]|uniref:Permuted papain-like amidase YaeF/Yiix C92 family enzyme n=1 Tax=Pseudonocardia parietis TaxID=570936 RepID=A0ABS4W1W7_9PSEU|nr:hypothetical protein [Pseudonocardia parietis]MBP2370197.1 hypothetical protein [Pseudonocardia parietis]